MVLFICVTVNDIALVKNLLEVFGEALGLKTNTPKSSVMSTQCHDEELNIMQTLAPQPCPRAATVVNPPHTPSLLSPPPPVSNRCRCRFPFRCRCRLPRTLLPPFFQFPTRHRCCFHHAHCFHLVTHAHTVGLDPPIPAHRVQTFLHACRIQAVFDSNPPRTPTSRYAAFLNQDCDLSLLRPISMLITSTGTFPCQTHSSLE